MRWEEAHQLARLKAAHVHKDMGIDPAERVDVFGAIRDADLLLAFEPMPRLSGAYFEAERAILVNSNHPLARQRFTGGHELGHFVFGHSSSIDPLTEPLARWGTAGAWPPEEKLAEAFSAWFLMPKTLVSATLEQMGVDRPIEPADVYALALRMGTSYSATARHLPNLRLATGPQVKHWLSTPPAEIKIALAIGSPPSNLQNDVWALSERDNELRVEVRKGDRLAIGLEDVPSSGYVWEPELRSDVRVVADSVRDESGRAALSDSLFEYIDEGAEGAKTHQVFVVEISADAETRVDELLFRRVRPWNNKVSRTFRLKLDIKARLRGISEDQMVVAA